MQTISSGVTVTVSSGTESGDTVLTGGTLIIESGGSATGTTVSGGDEVISSGGVDSGATILSGGSQNISSGGLGVSGTVYAGGAINVSSGGEASFITVSSGGTLNVAGTVTSHVEVYSSGLVVIASGGIETGAPGSDETIVSGGTVSVTSGGQLSYFTVRSGGVVTVDYGATIHDFGVSGGGVLNLAGSQTSNSEVFAGGTENVLSGGSAQNFDVSGGTLNVLSGGNVQDFTVSGGSLNVLSGGLSEFFTLSSGASASVATGAAVHDLTVSNGATLSLLGTATSYVFIADGATLNVSAGGAINGSLDPSALPTVTVVGTVNASAGASVSYVAVNSNGALNLQAGASAHDIDVRAGGQFNLAGSTTSNINIYQGGLETVSSGGAASGVNVFGSGELDVLAGGSANATMVDGGLLKLFSGGSLSGVSVTNFGAVELVSGASVSQLSNTTFGAGTYLEVGPGAVVSGYSVGSGPILDVLSGGSTSAITVTANGTENVFAGGTALGTFIGNGGFMEIGIPSLQGSGGSAGGTASNTTVVGGQLDVNSGGLAVSTMIADNGGAKVTSGGAVSGTTISNSGGMTVLSGGTAAGTTVLGGGYFQLGEGPLSGSPGSAGGSATGTVLSGGFEAVFSGGVDSGATILSGGNQTISSGGVTTGVMVTSGGVLNVSAGGSAAAEVASGGVENVLSGGLTFNTAVSSGGALNVSAGATAHDVTLSGGTLNVQGRITSNVTIQSGGHEIVSAGGSVTGVTGSGTAISGLVDVLSGASFEYATVFNGGDLNVSSGATADHISVSSGGIFNVGGTVLSNVSVFAGGIENVFSGGVVTGVTGSGTGISGGRVNVSSGGAIDHTTVISGGVLNIASGAAAHDIAVSSGGALNVAGAVTSNVAVFAGGNEIVSSGGSTGPVTISGGVVELQAGSVANGGITFSGSGGQLKIDGNSLAGTTISSLVLGDSIDLAGLNFVSGGSATLQAGNILHVTEGASSFDLQLDAIPGVRFSVGADSGTGTLVTTRADIAPVTSASNIHAGSGQTSVLASSLFTVSDADGDPITTYAFWDTQGHGHWVVNGVVQATNAEIDVAAANLSQVSYVFGPSGSTDTLLVRANDGTVWGGWTQFTAKAFGDTAPTVNAANVTAAHGQTSIAASSLFTVSDPDGDTMTQYAFWDTQGNGHFVVNGVVQATNAEIDVSAANLSQVSYVFGPGGSTPDTLWVKANDGSMWSAWKSFTATPGPDTAPVVTAPNVTAVHGEASALASSLFTVSDPDGDTMTQYAFWDTQGNGHFVVNGVVQATNAEIDVSAANLSQVSYVFGPGGSTPDTLWVKANDGSMWSTWTAFTATPGPDTAPVVTAPNVTAVHGETSALASSLFSVTDAEHDTITQYAFWDTQGNGHFVVNGVVQATNAEIDVSAANLSQVSYVFGPGGSTPDTLWVKANDGSMWSAWKSFTATPGPDTAPVVTAPNVTAVHGETSALASSLFSVTDAEHDTITQYAFWDTQGNGHFVVNGVVQATNAEIDVSAANLSQVSYVFGPGGSTPDTLWVKANDGSMWSAWKSFTATPGPDTAPVVTAPNVTAVHGETSALASSLFSVTDAENDTITQYAFWDTQGNGHFVVNGVVQATNAEIDVSAANLSQVSYVFGPGGSASDTLWVKANDGSMWSAWKSFTATPGPDTAPVVTASNVSGIHDHSVAASTLFSTTDAEHDTITQYAFWDTGGNGHFVVNGAIQAANVEIDVAAANLSQVSYVFGPGGSASDTLWVKANDGSEWSSWKSFTATATNQAPTVSVANVVTVSGQTFAAANLVTATDADGDAITKYALWDSNTNGHWSVNGAAQAVNTEIDITAAQLSQTTYQAGSGTDQLWIRAYDGIAWGAWQSFNATGESSTNATIAAGATLELPAASNAAVMFQGSAGTLKLDNSASFSGTVAGMTGSDAIDFANISFANVHTPTFSGDSSHGTLTVTDGTVTASIALLGNYMASTFTTSSDGHGGTLVVDPPAMQVSQLAQPQHA
ncbi:autotransporter passenger strand-loop-strand repeat protein [Bradyrhizobium sp. USDA 4011]